MRGIRGLILGYAAAALFGAWPILLVATAGTIASANGCTLHEGFRNPCVIGGTDVGGTLYTMAVMGWFMIATIPLGLAAAVLWTVLWLVLRRRTSRTV